jgi:hypothetical protein
MVRTERKLIVVIRARCDWAGSRGCRNLSVSVPVPVSVGAIRVELLKPRIVAHPSFVLGRIPAACH